jgi:hypothetical protein
MLRLEIFVLAKIIIAATQIVSIDREDDIKSDAIVFDNIM